MECLGTCFDSDGTLCASSSEIQVSYLCCNFLSISMILLSIVHGDHDLTLYSSFDGFRQALQLHKGDPTAIIQEIINTIEGGPPVDVSAVRSM